MLRPQARILPSRPYVCYTDRFSKHAGKGQRGSQDLPTSLSSRAVNLKHGENRGALIFINARRFPYRRAGRQK
jgi:hypothetical protein